MTADASGAPATPADALAALASVPETYDPALLLVAWSRGTDPELTATRPTDRLAEALRAVVAEHVVNWRERELVPYGPSTTVADGQLMWVAVNEVPLLASVNEADDLADLPLFDPRAAYAARLRLSAVRVPTNAGPATLYRRLSSRQIVGRSGKITILRRGDRMELVEDDVVLIDRGLDAVVVAGVALFADRSAFQRVFGFLEELRQQAAATFDDVTSSLRIAGIEAMRAAATGQPAMLGKMASIARKLREYPAYRQAITMPRLVEFVRANPHTGVEVEGVGEKAQLIFQPDPQHRFKILKLLDDDYLHSQLTEMEYEANSKGLPLTQSDGFVDASSTRGVTEGRHRRHGSD